MRATRWLAAVLIFSAGTRAWSAEGSVTAEFLTLPVGGRAAAMGEAYTAVSDDASALMWNPAALPMTRNSSVVFGHVPYLDQSAHDYAAVAHRTKPGRAWGLGFNYFSAGDVELTDTSGFANGSASPKDYAISLGHARALGGENFLTGWRWGVAGKYISSTLLKTARSTALDLGVLSPPLLKDHLVLGASAANIGRPLQYNQEKEALPRLYRFGSAYTIKPQWLATADIHWLESQPMDYSVGSEYQKVVGSHWTLAFRSGYNSMLAEESFADGISVGLGFAWKSWRVDYFYRGVTSDAGAQGIGLTWRFNTAGRMLSPALQALVDEGNRLMAAGQFPEAVLKFEEALVISATCREAQEGMAEAHRRMSGR